jgi:hypothetical protein
MRMSEGSQLRCGAGAHRETNVLAIKIHGEPMNQVVSYLFRYVCSKGCAAFAAPGLSHQFCDADFLLFSEV